MNACPRCDSADLMTLSLTLNGGPVTFVHCRGCEHRCWIDREQGGHLELPAVLTKVAR